MGGAIVCAVLSVVSALIVFVCHYSAGTIADGPPAPVMLTSGSPALEGFFLMCCIVFGLVSLALVVPLNP
jgi:hypothetical protein